MSDTQYTVYKMSEPYESGQVFHISEIMHTSLEAALNNISGALEIEETFQVFAQSFLRFEKDALDIVFEHTFSESRTAIDEDFLGNVGHKFNVNLLTILTSFFSYEEHSKRILKRIKIEGADTFDEINRKSVYDENQCYRICTALRNYAQHRALPLGGFTVGGKSKFIRGEDGKTIKGNPYYSISPWLNSNKLLESKKCNAPVKNDLQGIGYTRIDLKWLVRNFAEGMYDRHSKLRAFLHAEIKSAELEIIKAYELATSEKGEKVKHLNLCIDGHIRPMREDLAAKFFRYSNTHKALKHASRIYITSEIVNESNIYSGSQLGT